MIHGTLAWHTASDGHGIAESLFQDALFQPAIVPAQLIQGLLVFSHDDLAPRAA